LTSCDTGRLLDAAKAGDRSALDVLFARHRGRLLALANCRMSRTLANAVSAEDVVQETCLEAARKLHSFEAQGPESFYRWLAAIARFKVNEAARARRAMKRAAEAPLDAEPPSPATSPSGRAIKAESAARLAAAIESLPADQAEAIRLRWLEGLSVADAAALLGKSAPAVKGLVARGLATLAERLPHAC
jgi:RNA polymerase sigma-70 factor (ECF subfamily)